MRQQRDIGIERKVNWFIVTQSICFNVPLQFLFLPHVQLTNSTIKWSQPTQPRQTVKDECDITFNSEYAK